MAALAQPVKVYTLTAREDHAFYANGILVRDGCGDKTPFFLLPPPPGEASPVAQPILAPAGAKGVAQ
jgi:hypothetical protein